MKKKHRRAVYISTLIISLPIIGCTLAMEFIINLIKDFYTWIEYKLRLYDTD